MHNDQLPDQWPSNAEETTWEPVEQNTVSVLFVELHLFVLTFWAGGSGRKTPTTKDLTFISYSRGFFLPFQEQINQRTVLNTTLSLILSSNLSHYSYRLVVIGPHTEIMSKFIINA